MKLKAVSAILKRHFSNLTVERTIDIADEIINACIIVEETGMTPEEARKRALNPETLAEEPPSDRFNPRG